MSWESIPTSGLAWSAIKESGNKVEYLFGHLGIGSPHAHIVIVLDHVRYWRDVSGLTAEILSNGSPYIYKV